MCKNEHYYCHSGILVFFNTNIQFLG
jgi:hypothetical protein